MEKPTADIRTLERSSTAGPSGQSTRTLVPAPALRWKTRVLLPVLLVGAIAMLMIYSAWNVIAPAEDVRVVPVMARQDLGPRSSATVQAPGWLEPDPFPIAVPALADGVVEEVLVLEGEPVEAGQVVAKLVTKDAELSLARAAAQVVQREAELVSARAELRAAQSNWDFPIEPQRRVAAAEARLAESRVMMAMWPFELAAEEARTDVAKAEFDRLQRLHENQQCSEIEYIRARQEHEQQRAVTETTRTRKGVLAAQIDSAQAELDAARRALELRIAERRALADAGAQVDRAEASLVLATASRQEAALRLERMSVVSPVTGIVMRREVEPGSKLIMTSDQPHSQHVVHVYDPARLQVRVDVPLAEAAGVSVGQQARIVAPVLPDKVYRGRVTRVVHEADIQKNTLQVKVAIDDPSPDLKPEILARVQFLALDVTGDLADEPRLFAPRSLIMATSGQSGQVWTVDATGSRAHLRDIRIGAARTGDWVEVIEGLRVGDWLIADGRERLADGDRIRVEGEAAMSEPAFEEEP